MNGKSALLVMLGGCTGSFLRYWVGSRLHFQPTEFAWGTFMINMAGCFAIGSCYPLFTNDYFRAFIIIGLLGGFTTFSGFGLEIYRYLEAGSTKIAFTYSLVSVYLGTVLVWIGYKLAKWLF